jgi:hypothetical protein
MLWPTANNNPSTQFFNLTPNGATNLTVTSSTINCLATETGSVELLYSILDGTTSTVFVQVSNEGQNFTNTDNIYPALPNTRPPLQGSGVEYIMLGDIPAPFVQIGINAPLSGSSFTAGMYVHFRPVFVKSV